MENTHMCIISANYWPTVTKFASQVHVIRVQQLIRLWFDLLFKVTGVEMQKSNFESTRGSLQILPAAHKHL